MQFSALPPKFFQVPPLVFSGSSERFRVRFSQVLARARCVRRPYESLRCSCVQRRQRAGLRAGGLPGGGGSVAPLAHSVRGQHPVGNDREAADPDGVEPSP